MSLAAWQFRPLSELETLPPTEWLVQRYVPENALILVYGKPNSFKSFLALDWAMCLSAGKGWLGAKVRERKRVCYIMGEGLRGLKQRTEAWKAARGEAGDIFFLEKPVSLLDAKSCLHLKAEVKRLQPSFLVVDTVARCFGGGDENSTQDMNRFVAACDELRSTVSGMTLTLVHHTGWSEEAAQRPRGSIALHAATDVEYLCTRKGLEMKLSQPRTKDGEEMDPEHYLMCKVGDSLVIERNEGVDPRTRTRRARARGAEMARAGRLAKRRVKMRDSHVTP